MIYGFENKRKNKDSARKSDSKKNYEKLPKVRDIVVIDSKRLDSTEGTPDSLANRILTRFQIIHDIPVVGSRRDYE